MRPLRVNFRKIFLTGILIVLPALITFFLLHFLFGKVNQYVTPYLRKALAYLPGWENGLAEWFGPWLPVLALVLTLILIFAVGLLGTNYLGRKLIEAFHNVMLRIPMIKGIYGSAKQLFDAFNLPGVRAFEEVCMIEYPRRGLYCLGFITRDAEGEIQEKLGVPTAYVFLPTTPNPTSGYLLVVPRDEVQVLDMTIDEGIKLIVSGGMVMPSRRPVPFPGRNPDSLPGTESSAEDTP